MSAQPKQEPLCEVHIVGQNTSFEGLPLAGRVFVSCILLPIERFVFFCWQWRNAPHIQGVYEREEEADADAETYPRGFVQKSPWNRSHPAALCQLGRQYHPNSPAVSRYLRRRFKNASVNTDLLDELSRDAKRLNSRQKI